MDRVSTLISSGETRYFLVIGVVSLSQIMFTGILSFYFFKIAVHSLHVLYWVRLANYMILDLRVATSDYNLGLWFF